MLLLDHNTVPVGCDNISGREGEIYERGNKREPGPTWWPNQDQVERDAHDLAVAADPDHPFPPDPDPPGEEESLTDRYRAVLADPDPAVRAMAGEQLRRLQEAGYRAPGASSAAQAPGADLPALARETVPVHRRGADRYDCGCPTGHASKSGLPCTLWGDAEGWRWYCRSCRRGGGAIGWLMAVGLTYGESCRRLGIVPTRPARGRPRRGTPRPPLDAVALPEGWHPAGEPLPGGWRPGLPLREGATE